MFQRLQQRMNRQKVIQESEPELLSFYPEPDDGMSLALLQLNMLYFFKTKNITLHLLSLQWSL